MLWSLRNKADPTGAALADGHYSRRKVGAPQFMPPGETVVLVSPDGLSVFGWWRPHPRSGIKSMNGLDGWTCSIFRHTGPALASQLVVAAECALLARGVDCGPDGLLTYVFDRKVASPNPGYCFKRAGYRTHPSKPRSADGRKSLLWKPWFCAGWSP
jgi:hypothetical protein